MQTFLCRQHRCRERKPPARRLLARGSQPPAPGTFSAWSPTSCLEMLRKGRAGADRALTSSWSCRAAGGARAGTRGRDRTWALSQHRSRLQFYLVCVPSLSGGGPHPGEVLHPAFPPHPGLPLLRVLLAPLNQILYLGGWGLHGVSSTPFQTVGKWASTPVPRAANGYALCRWPAPGSCELLARAQGWNHVSWGPARLLSLTLVLAKLPSTSEPRSPFPCL